MQRGFWIILGVIVAAMIGLFVLTGGKEEGGENNYTYTEPMQVQEQDHKSGSGKAVLIEYGDFECDGCGRAFPIVNALKQANPDKMQFVFRHFPLTSIHPNAMAGHRAAVAAGKQGKFWEMHDLLFQTQTSWRGGSNVAATFENFAQQLGLNVEQFKTDVASADTFNRINADMSSGSGLGVNSTPTFYLNGKKLEEVPRDLAGWQALIDQAAQ